MVKLLGQIIAAIVVVAFGVRIDEVTPIFLPSQELKEAFCEIFERNKYETCLKKELPQISKERKQLRVNSSHFKRNIFHVWWEMHL